MRLGWMRRSVHYRPIDYPRSLQPGYPYRSGCALGREPRIMLAPRIMLSLTSMERPMRPLAKSADETFLIAPRIRESVIARSRFEP